MQLERVLKGNSYWLIEKFFNREIQTPGQISLQEIKSVLVVRQHDQLGDFMLSTPVLRALRERFPQARIGLVVREYFAEVANMNPFVDEVLIFYENISRWTWSRFRQLWHQLRGRWDMCVVLNTVSHSMTSDVIAHFSKAPIILGSAACVFPGCHRNFFYNIESPVDEKIKHQTLMNLDIVRCIGVETTNVSEVLIVPDEEQQSAKRLLQQQGVHFQSPVIGLHIGAGKPANRWSSKSFAELAKIFHQKNSADVVLFWGPKEDSLQEEFSSHVDFPIVKIPPTNLRELTASFTQCDVVVCNDTGVMHVAAAAGVPLVAIFGATDPSLWKPIGDKFEYVYSKDGIEHIQVSNVIEKINYLLKNYRRKIS